MVSVCVLICLLCLHCVPHGLRLKGMSMVIILLVHFIGVMLGGVLGLMLTLVVFFTHDTASKESYTDWIGAKDTSV